MTDLGPNDADDITTTATASFVFTVAGTYKVCYRVWGGSWAQVGSNTDTVVVRGVAPTGWSDDGSVCVCVCVARHAPPTWRRTHTPHST